MGFAFSQGRLRQPREVELARHCGEGGEDVPERIHATCLAFGQLIALIRDLEAGKAW